MGPTPCFEFDETRLFAFDAWRQDFPLFQTEAAAHVLRAPIEETTDLLAELGYRIRHVFTDAGTVPLWVPAPAADPAAMWEWTLANGRPIPPTHAGMWLWARVDADGVFKRAMLRAAQMDAEGDLAFYWPIASRQGLQKRSTFEGTLRDWVCAPLPQAVFE